MASEASFVYILSGQKLIENAKIKKMRHFGWFLNTVHSSFSGANKSVVMQEFVAMDERMTNQMLSVQQQAVNLGLLAQKMEDDLGSSSGSSKGKNFFGLRKKKSGAAHSSGNGSQNRDSNSRSSTLTSVDPNRPYSPVDLGKI